MQGKVEICGVNTARLKTLTHGEMDTLLRLSKAGDKKAREKLIEGNLRLVLSVIAIKSSFCLIADSSTSFGSSKPSE